MSTVDGSADKKRRMAALFDSIAPRYDALRFVQRCAARLLEHSALFSGARVLDVATGTGLVALVAAELVGPDGAVVGVDIAPTMLAWARQKRAAPGAAQVDFRLGDAERLEFADESFAVVLCALSLFFVPDMRAALREAYRVLAPGGMFGYSSFGPSFQQPLRALWDDCLRRHGLTPPTPPFARLADPAVCAQLLREAGFARVEVRSEQLGYYLASAEERWQEIVTSLDGILLRQLDAALCEHLRVEHSAELTALATAEGIWVDLPAHFTFGWREGGT